MKIFDNGITTAAKCRGERKLVEKVAEMSIADMEPGSPYELLYGNDPACLEELRRLMVQQLGYEPAAVYQIGAADAANSGPRVVGVAFTRKKESGILLSLRGIPNGAFAQKNGFPLIKRLLFTLAGAKYDRKAKRQGKAYRFLFVRADGAQLEKITQIVEANHIVSKIDPHEFDLSRINDALQLVAGGHINGKVIVRFP